MAASKTAYHVFTDKKGQTIEAALLSINPDKSKIGIERRDGRKFEIPILSLSLDDQQFIKNWLEGNPIKSDHNLEVSFIKHQESTERTAVPNSGGLKWVEDTSTIEIKIKNRSRIDLKGASLHYYIIIEQGVNATVMAPESQQSYGVKEWWYPNAPDVPIKRKKGKKLKEKKPLWVIHGQSKIDDLAYNFSMEVQSSPFPLREISQSGASGANPKDVILGTIAKITDKDGKEIILTRSTENGLMKRGWDEISRMPSGDMSGTPVA
ncbi:MAG: hypothetical protein GXP30_14090, partial [Verrucomicrobia bacterium]|nr:hypothetical protein [Verrucomicrobiota bacterium]